MENLVFSIYFKINWIGDNLALIGFDYSFEDSVHFCFDTKIFFLDIF